MVEIIGYHGTNKKRGKDILNNNKMKLSFGDRHWLGDGSYFYEEDFFAYKWIVDMYYKSFSKNPREEELKEEYSIIKAIIKIEKNRIFDLDTLEHRMLYDITYKKIKQKKEYSQKFKSRLLVEGVVINYLFNIFDYGKDYDVVYATFVINKNNYKEIYTKIGYVCQKQLCIKNLDVIKDLKEYDYTNKLATFYRIKDILFIENTSLPMSYIPKKRGINNGIMYKI